MAMEASPACVLLFQQAMLPACMAEEFWKKEREADFLILAGNSPGLYSG